MKKRAFSLLLLLTLVLGYIKTPAYPVNAMETGGVSDNQGLQDYLGAITSNLSYENDRYMRVEWVDAHVLIRSSSSRFCP